jgi:MFS family permease
VRPSGRLRVFAGFAALGVFWGSWGALVPAVQAQASADDGELGIAVLMIALGALASMRLCGALVDRYGQIVLPIVTALFGAAGFLPALASSPLALGAALLAVGVGSGALDVAANAAGVDEESDSGRPLMNFAHACFSASVVVASLATAALRALGAQPRTILAIVFVVTVAAALGPLRPSGAKNAPAKAKIAHGERPRWRHLPPTLLGLGVLCAIAFVIENAWQTWSAVHLEVTFGAAPGTSGLAPAVFAGACVAGRLSGNIALRHVRGHILLSACALVAAVGSARGARAGSPAVALVGIALAGVGTSVCAPTLLGMAGAWAGAERRAAAISTVTTVGYLGFLLGPFGVGLAASATTLATALSMVGALALVLAVLAWLLSRSTPARSSPWRSPS